MAKYLSPEKMGLVGEGLQCWNKLEDKLANKLSQLTKLLHHFSAYPPEAENSDENPEEIASQHESEIHDILNETASRIRLFKSSLQIQEQDNRLQEAVEAMKSEHEAIQCATLRELKKAESVAKQLEESMKESERVLRESMKTQAETFAREMRLQRSELQARAEELDKARLTSQQYRREVEEVKKCHQIKMEHEKGHLVKISQDLQLQLRAREIELQEHVKNQSAVHCQTVQVGNLMDWAGNQLRLLLLPDNSSGAAQEMKALQTAEVERLKLESFVELEKLSHDCASREADWQNEKLEFQKQIAVAAKEKMQLSLSAESQILEGKLSIKAMEEALAKEKESTSKLQNALNVAEEDIHFMKENMKTASINNDNLAIALATMEQEALESRIQHNSAISKWDTVATTLRQDLENMTNTCAANENDIKGYQIKVDELAFQLVTTRKELSLTKIELEWLHAEMQKLTSEIDSKEQQKQRVEADSEARIGTLTAEISRLQLECIAQNENSAQKMKEMMELRVQQQLQAHESDVQNLQMAFISQLEEDRKENKLQLKTLEGNLLRQREEKARAKSACEEFSKALNVVQQKLEEQESKSLSQMLKHDAKVVALIEKLISLEVSGSNLDEEFGSLSKQVLKHSKQSKQVASMQQKILRETEEKCQSLESALTNLTREHAASTEQHTEVVEHLKQAMADQEQAHDDAVAAASESHNTQIQQCMDDVQRLKDEHSIASAQIRQEHEMKLAKSRSTIEAQKNVEAVEARVKLDNRLQRNKQELNEEMDLMKLGFERALCKQKDALDEIQKKHDRLLRAHLGVVKDQKEAAEAELERCQQENAQALTSCIEKWSQELNKLDEDHTKQLDKLEQNHFNKLQDMRATYQEKLSTSEESWKQKLELVEKEWKCRLDNDETLWRIDRDSDIEELRKSLLFSSTEEKNSMALDHKIRVCKLENRISELETLLAQKDERIRRLLQDIARMDESSKILLLDLKTKHKGHLCDMLEKQRVELFEVQRESAALIEELHERQKVELETSHEEMEKVKVQMKEKQVDLEKKLEKLQERFVNRESRVEDVAHISKLQLTCEQKDITITKLNGRTSQLQLELYNREETYNKIFGNSPPPILQQGVSDWLRPKNKSDTCKVDHSMLSCTAKADRNGKVDVAKVALLQKRAASAARQIPKAADNNGRSASTLI